MESADVVRRNKAELFMSHCQYTVVRKIKSCVCVCIYIKCAV